MKKFNKVLAIVLILALVLGSAPAFATNNVAAVEVEPLQTARAMLAFSVNRYTGMPHEDADRIVGARINIYVNGTLIETFTTEPDFNPPHVHTIPGHIEVQLVYAPGNFCLRGEDGELKSIGYFDGITDFFEISGWFLNPCNCGTTPPPPPPVFSDVQYGSWFYNYANYMHEQGYMIGVGGNRFAPFGTSSRAMAITIVHRIAGEPVVAAEVATLSDISNDSWYSAALRWAYAEGIVEEGNGIFRPSEDVTREELAVFLFRLANYLDIDLGTTTAHFPDMAEVSEDARAAVALLGGAGVIKGTTGGRFNPHGDATRAEMAALFYRFLNL